MEEDAFKKLGLEITTEPAENLKVGQSYPIYGMVTKFLSEELGNVIVEVNYSILLTLFIDDIDKVNTIKERAFEPGIFMVTVKEIDTADPEYCIKGTCSTVVFGRKQTEFHS
jgi:hypothetical protein